MYQAGCRFFNGYKPCQKNLTCNTHCPSLDIPEKSILLVHLGAMGAVLRSTALLRMIKRKYPSSFIIWVTEDHSRPLLENNPLVDKVLGLSARDQLILSSMAFDIGFFVDKSAEVAGLQALVNIEQSFGFTTNEKTGAIVPLNSSAQALWELGLDNHKKFFVNQRTELELISEALELPFANDEYLLALREGERDVSDQRRREWSQDGKFKLIGLNTGTSGVLPFKTIPIFIWRDIIARLNQERAFKVVLLGGSSDQERNQIIGSGHSVIQSPTNSGLRDGMCSIAATDVVITADSLGMHMAIALQKKIVAWFGPTCAHEMDLYGRGIKLKSSMACSPCWKRNCDQAQPCCDRIDTHEVVSSVKNIMGLNLKQSFNDQCASF
ncbi:MAG: hypothetical protein RJB66_2100 [Pseudomonadota bacterium]|jgi:heptosyltransferase-2